MELREKKIWNGTSPEGFDIEIQFWGAGTMCDGAGMWNYYVIVREAQVAPEVWAQIWLEPKSYWDRSSGERTPIYNEYSSILSDADWHGGITYYEKYAEVDGTCRFIKVGCDYGHAFDRDANYGYDLAYVQHDALATCADLARLLNPKTRCGYTGRYFDPRFDMSKTFGRFKGALSPAGLGHRSAWDRKRRERDFPHLFAAA